MSNFILFSDMHYTLGASKSYIRSDGMYSWLYEQIEVTRQIFDYARENDVKWVIHNGDFFEDKNRINVGLYNTIWELYKKLSEEFDITFNIGNHDVSTMADSSLKPFSDIVQVIEEVNDIYWKGTGIRIIPYSQTEGNLKLPIDSNKNILILHEEIAGLSLGPTDYKSGSNLKHQIFGDWDLVFNGHIHKPQTLGNIINIGSPMHRDWGEVGEEKRFIHYKDGEIISIPTNCPKFISLSGLTDRVKEKLKRDDRNFYRIDVGTDEIKDDLFNKHNVSFNIVKAKKREVRLDSSKIMTEEEEMKEYIRIRNPDLDCDKLLKIGLEIIK